MDETGFVANFFTDTNSPSDQAGVVAWIAVVLIPEPFVTSPDALDAA